LRCVGAARNRGSSIDVFGSLRGTTIKQMKRKPPVVHERMLPYQEFDAAGLRLPHAAYRINPTVFAA
jgi:hypothetical protein